MRIVKRRMQRIWRQRRCIVLVQLDQRGDQILRVAVLGSECISLELVLARCDRQQRREQEGELHYVN